MIRAVVFDLDGVLLSSEELWDEARREVTAEHGGRWQTGATSAMQGMSSLEWSAYLRDELGVDLSTDRIVELVTDRLFDHYRYGLPFLPGASDAVRRMAGRWPLALASSSNRTVIDKVLSLSALEDCFSVTVSSEEVPRGKPEPDVYLEAARRLGRPAPDCAAIEDSANGIRSAVVAGLHVVAVPNRDYPPSESALAEAQLVLKSITDLTVANVEELDGAEPRSRGHLDEEEDEAEAASFPASDPHSDWAGPAT